MKKFVYMKRCIVLIFLLPSLGVADASGIHTGVLSNGFTYIVKENHTAPIADVRIYVQTGSIYEQEYLGSGISHYFEHLINGGTTSTYSEKEISDLIDKLGGANNAYTTKDHTCYYITTSSDMIGNAIDLMADWMVNSTFPENEFKREKGIVIEELIKGREEPHRIMYTALYETMFTKHPVKYPVIGYENQIKSINRDHILSYYNRMYAPNNMVIVAVGDFNQKEVKDRISKAFETFERRALPALSLPSEPKQLGIRERTLRKKGLGESYVTIAYHTIPIDHQDLYPLDVLSYILSHGRSSRLVKSLQEEKRVVSSIYTYSNTPEYDAGVFGITAKCQDENLETSITEILAEIEKVKESGVSKEEINKAIKQKLSEDILGNQTASSEASDLGINMITTGNPEFNKIYLEGIKLVKSEEIQAVAQKYFHTENMTLIKLRPEKEELETTQKKSEISSQPIKKITLKNGMRFLLKRNPNIPLINIQALFLGGVLYEDQDKAGLCNITAEMLTRGTETRTREEIASTFDQIGGRFSSSSGNNTFGLNAEILKEDFHIALNIFADSLQNPTFDHEELETVKQRNLSRISGRTDRWDSEISYLFRQNFFNQHPYRNDSLGSTEFVESITTEHVKDYYNKFVTPERCIITVFGDMDLKETEDLLTKAFKDFNGSSNPLPPIPSQSALIEDEVVLKEVNKNLSAVFIGYPGIKITNTQDRFPFIVLDTVLSGFGYPGGWLHEHLRGGDKDYVYLVHAFNFTGLAPGYFGIMAASAPEKMDKVIEIIQKDVNKIRTNLVDEEELEKAKIICKTMEKLNRQTNADMALQAAIDELYGLGYDFSENYTNRINAVTAEEVLRVAKKYLTYSTMVRTKPAISPESTTSRIENE